MSINWVTLIAQILNFLILVILLYFVLFRKIIQVMDERQKRVETQLNEAKMSRQKADQDKAILEKEKEQMQQQKSVLLTKLHDEVSVQKEALIKKSQEEVDEKRKAWESEINSQKEQFFQTLRKMAGESGLLISRQVMKELADSDLQQLIEKSFVQKLNVFLESQKPQDFGESARIASAFPMSESTLHQINDILKKSQGKTIGIETRLSPELLLGVELTMGSTKIAWNVEERLQKLHEKMDSAFSQFEKTNEK